jgi:hypothetical protein
MLEYIHQIAQHHIQKLKDVIYLLLLNQTTFYPSKAFIIVFRGGGLPMKMTNFHASVIQYKTELHKNKLQLSPYITPFFGVDKK